MTIDRQSISDARSTGTNAFAFVDAPASIGAFSTGRPSVMPVACAPLISTSALR